MEIHLKKLIRPFILFFAGCLISAVHASPFAVSPDGNAVVRIIEPVGAPPLNTGLITAEYPNLAVTNGGVPGRFSLGTYEAAWDGTAGGARFTGVYTQQNGIGALQQLNYIQIINTNVPLGGATSPYIDPQPNDDNLPFYWTKAEAFERGTPNAIRFSDFSTRDQGSLIDANPITWSAELYPVIDDGAGGVQVGNGVTWGWDMKPATVGSSSGTFDMPSPTCPPATCNGLGSNAVNWGVGNPSALTFTGTPFSPRVGDPFKIGTLDYTNGTTVLGTAISGINLDIALAFDNVPEDNFVYHAGLVINTTPNTADPIASADSVSFVAGSFGNTFNVLEGTSATADLMARLTPVLQITPSLVGDKDPDRLPDQLVFVGYQLQLVGLANPSDGGFVTTAAVPLPGSLSLFLIGLLASRFAGRRRPGKGVRLS